MYAHAAIDYLSSSSICYTGRELLPRPAFMCCPRIDFFSSARLKQCAFFFYSARYFVFTYSHAIETIVYSCFKNTHAPMMGLSSRQPLHYETLQVSFSICKLAIHLCTAIAYLLIAITTILANPFPRNILCFVDFYNVVCVSSYNSHLFAS